MMMRTVSLTPLHSLSIHVPAMFYEPSWPAEPETRTQSLPNTTNTTNNKPPPTLQRVSTAEAFSMIFLYTRL